MKRDRLRSHMKARHHKFMLVGVLVVSLFATGFLTACTPNNEAEPVQLNTNEDTEENASETNDNTNNNVDADETTNTEENNENESSEVKGSTTQTNETDDVSEPIETAVGIYNGQVDNNSVEIAFTGASDEINVFKITDEVRDEFEALDLKADDDIAFEYQNQATGQPLLLTITKIEKQSSETLPDIKEGKGKYSGQADSHSIEIEVSEKGDDEPEYRVFQITDQVRSTFESLELELDDEIIFEYTEEENGQLNLINIEKIN